MNVNLSLRSHCYSPGSGVYPQMVWPAHLGERALFLADVAIATAGLTLKEPWQYRVESDCWEHPDYGHVEPREMLGFLASLTPEQQAAALAYRGEDC